MNSIEQKAKAIAARSAPTDNAKRNVFDAMKNHGFEYAATEAGNLAALLSTNVNGVAVAQGQPMDCTAFVDNNGIDHAIDTPLVTSDDMIEWWHK